MSFFLELTNFINIANNQVTGQGIIGVQEFNNKRITVYNELKVISKLGTGRASATPWIAFLKDTDTVQNGIYPLYLYFKFKNLLILSYGVSETKKATRTWNLADGIRINDFFLRTYNQNAPKYGESYVFKTYDLNKPLDQSEIDQDLNDLIRIYKSNITMSNPLIDQPSTVKVHKNSAPFSVMPFNEKTSTAGLIFSTQLAQRFIASLLTKPFVICSGLSGSGKTKLAQAFVQWISENENQYKIIPVGADWTNREPLLGYPNGLDPKSYITPDSGALQLMIEANSNTNKPYFLILDEMNLSHVERYFADFLSIMESGDSIKLYSGAERMDSADKPIPKEIGWPKNLFIIGTVNIDETTYMFSPKVLDRANVIEFRITPEEMKNFFNSNANLDMNKLFVDGDKSKGGLGQDMGESFFQLASEKSIVKIPEIEGEHNILNKFFVELQNVGSEFGYRSAMEMELLITKLGIDCLNDENGNPLENNVKIDIAIMQKLLPKIHGSRKKLVLPLETLAGFCVKQTQETLAVPTSNAKTIYQQYLSDKGDLNKWTILFPISFEKIERMYKNVIDNGFTSYAEA
jgi:5-methylcytosine-specific restriction protein B